MYAKMWEQDYLSKCQREEMEKVLQIERNKEMLEVKQMTNKLCVASSIINTCVTFVGSKFAHGSKTKRGGKS